MGIGDRHSRRTTRFDSRELAKLTSKDVPDETVPAPNDANKTAAEATLEIVAEEPEQTADQSHAGQLAHRARTSTVHDPFTTGLLAEVARRSKTIEVSPEMVEEATANEPEARERTAPPNKPSRARR